jgi:predicted nucleotidyltransferase
MLEKTGVLEVARLSELAPVFESDPAVVLAFLFGSYARGQQHARSDVDVALLLAPDVPREQYLDYRLKYIQHLTRLFRDDRVDVVILNTAPPLLAHEAIGGKMLFERSPEARVEFMVRVQREYLDMQYIYDVSYRYLRERLRNGTYGQPSSRA